MKKYDARNITAIIERLGRLLGNDAHTTGLLPVHWETLRYLERANRFSRNSTALTAFLGSTKGTVSQTIKTLERKGLLNNQPDSRDRRRNQLSLTAKGERFLSEDPFIEWQQAVEELPESIRAPLATGLQRLLSKRLDANERRPFGQCQSCIYFAAQHEDGEPHFCLLLKETLSETDSEAICHEQTGK